MAVYRYVFAPEVPLVEVESSLLLATWSCEALHGECQVELEVGHCLQAASRTLVIAEDTEAGKDLNRLFLGLIRREFAAGSFRVERITAESMREPA